jgi:hypothetical protein
MSKENRPNLNAVGFMVDIWSSLDKRIRGEAKRADRGERMQLLAEMVKEFVEEVDEKLNLKYGRH